ncbi:MAG: hypothetical protein LBV75_02065 [Paludibacter sp.]|jgi:hypothetical protein|nr:hypothetical protein [Paludibacter sp.]
MDSFDDYIYLIILAASIVGGLLKKGKKNAKQATAKQQIPSPSAFEPDETYIADEVQPAPLTQYLPESVISYENTTDTSVLRLKNDMKSVFTELKKDRQKSQFQSDEEEKEEWSSEFKFEFDDADEVRKAIVYSEVFAPKYNLV